MIHQAARDMAIDRLGQAGWDGLVASNGFSSRDFIGLDTYSDAQTMALIDMIAERLEISRDAALFDFGRRWMDFASASFFGRTLRMAGSDLETFLGNLDRMHAGLKSNLPTARMPSFQVLTADCRYIEVLYVSERDGLVPFTHGLLTAVAERFGANPEIAIELRANGVVFRFDHKAACREDAARSEGVA